MATPHLQDLSRILRGLRLVISHAAEHSKLAQRLTQVYPAASSTGFGRAMPQASSGMPAASTTASHDGSEQQEGGAGLATRADSTAEQTLEPSQETPTLPTPRLSPQAATPTPAPAPPTPPVRTPLAGAPLQHETEPAQQLPAKGPRKKFQFVPREAAVPSNSITRALNFAGLGASLLFGTARESVSRAFRGKESSGGSGDGGAEPLHSAFLSEANAERLAWHLCRMRGAALKLGQMLSIQDDNLLPPQFQAAMQRVRAGADVMPRKQLEKVLAGELGKDWRQRVAHFEDTPMAAASIGQVHLATLHDGRKVCIKVQYPGVAKSIDADIDNLMRLISVANLLPKGLYVENAVKVAKRELALECDYRWEAAAQTRFAALVASDTYTAARFHVPAVVPELSSERVLTSEWVPGVHVDRVEELDQSVRDVVGTRLLALTLKELYDWRFVQSDPNFANFLWDEDAGVLHLIDFGAAREYPAAFVSEYLEMVKACGERDAAGIIARSTSLGFLTGDESQVMLDAHVEAAEAVGTPFATEGLHDFGAQSGVTRRVTELGAVMLKHRLTPPPEESYSLHRKLAGAFLACIKLRARVPCRELFSEEYKRHHAAGSPAVAAPEYGGMRQAAVA